MFIKSHYTQLCINQLFEAVAEELLRMIHNHRMGTNIAWRPHLNRLYLNLQDYGNTDIYWQFDEDFSYSSLHVHIHDRSMTASQRQVKELEAKEHVYQRFGRTVRHAADEAMELMMDAA